MSAGTKETMGAASALSNLSARLGSVFGPLLLSIIWSLLPGSTLHMSAGGVVFVALAVLSVLCAWLVSPQPDYNPAKTGSAPSTRESLARQEE